MGSPIFPNGEKILFRRMCCGLMVYSLKLGLYIICQKIHPFPSNFVFSLQHLTQGKGNVLPKENKETNIKLKQRYKKNH